MAQLIKLLLLKLKHATDRSSLKLTLEELSQANFRERREREKAIRANGSSRGDTMLPESDAGSNRWSKDV